MSTFQKAKQKARAAGIAPGEATLRWIQENYPQAMSEAGGGNIRFTTKITRGEIGRVGSAATVSSGWNSFESAKRRARKAGCAPGRETLEWIQKNCPAAMSGVNL